MGKLYRKMLIWAFGVKLTCNVPARPKSDILADDRTGYPEPVKNAGWWRTHPTFAVGDIKR